MRWIQKCGPVPAAIRDYLANQLPVGYGLDYDTFSHTASPFGGSRGGQLRKELTTEQYGLCAYTGCGIDERLGSLADPAKKLKLSAHNEHIKAQSVCRQELTTKGKTPGVDIGDDMAYNNIVAALLVSGNGKTRREDLFGAVHRQKDPVPLPPTDYTCEHRFIYDAGTGEVSADNADQDAKDTIAVLNLNHQTLKDWRKQAIETFMEIVRDRADLTLIVTKTTVPENRRLPEYCFAIRQVAERLLAGNAV